jgi:hypothetical protein
MWYEIFHIKTKVMRMCGKNIQRVEMDKRVIEQESDFICLGNMVSELEKNTDIELQRYIKNCIIERSCRTQMSVDTNLSLRDVTSKGQFLIKVVLTC